MKFVARSVFLAAILLITYYVYQRPEIRELFTRSKAEGDPLAFLENLPEISPQTRPERSTVRAKPRAVEPATVSAPAAEAEAEESSPDPEYHNQVPNEELRKVLMQIFAAKKLARGISLSVTDDKVSLAGEIASDEERKQILDIVDKGREARRIDAQHLKLEN